LKLEVEEGVGEGVGDSNSSNPCNRSEGSEGVKGVKANQ